MATKKKPAGVGRPDSRVAVERPPIKDSQFARMLRGNPFTMATAAQWDAFLQTLAATGNVTKSAEAAKISKISCYARRSTDPEFADLWDKARDIGFASLEDEAKRRAYDGIEKGIYYQGAKVDTVTEYSDPLLMFLLQGNDSRYKRKQEITGAEGGPLAILAAMDDEGLDALIKARSRELAELKPE